MDYLINFNDGSEALAHYDVKGMKWGVWNEETRRRHASAGNGTYYRKAQRGDKYSQAVTNQRRAYNANQPKSKQIAKNLLMTPLGAHGYNTARSRGLSRADALLAGQGAPFYELAVKRKQRKLGTTKPMISRAAKERADYTRNESLKKTIAKDLLLGAPGSMAYNSVKARTKSRGKALLVSAGIPIAGAAVGVAGGTAIGIGAGLAPAAAATTLGSNLGSYANVGTTYGVAAAQRRGSYKKQVKGSGFKTRRPEEKLTRSQKKADKAYAKAKNSYDLASRNVGRNSSAAKGQREALAKAEFDRAYAYGDSKGMRKARTEYASVINDPKVNKLVPVNVAGKSKNKVAKYQNKQKHKREKTLNKMDRALG